MSSISLLTLNVFSVNLFTRKKKLKKINVKDNTNLDDAVNHLKKRFGNLVVRRAITIDDPMGCLDAKKDHIIHPIGYF